MLALKVDASRVHPVRLTYGDINDEEKLEKDRTLMLCLIVTDWTRLIVTGTLLEMTRRWVLRLVTLSSCIRSSLDC